MRYLRVEDLMDVTELHSNLEQVAVNRTCVFVYV